MANPANYFKPGVSGNPKGRLPGSTNYAGKKLPIRFDVARIVNEIKYIDPVTGEARDGFNPFAALVQLAVNARSEKVKCEALCELASYLAPKLKSVNFTSDQQMPFSIILNMGNNIEYNANNNTIDGNISREEKNSEQHE